MGFRPQRRPGLLSLSLSSSFLGSIPRPRHGSSGPRSERPARALFCTASTRLAREPPRHPGPAARALLLRARSFGRTSRCSTGTLTSGSWVARRHVVPSDMGPRLLHPVAGLVACHLAPTLLCGPLRRLLRLPARPLHHGRPTPVHASGITSEFAADLMGLRSTTRRRCGSHITSARTPYSTSASAPCSATRITSA